MTAPEVTFLFTDIEGSTRRWEADPTAMSAALARHDRLLRQAVADHGGEPFKHTGDGICAAFSTPSSALRASVGAQRALLAENWESVGGLRVRMAIHTGTAEQRGGDFFGQPLNRTARLLGTAHGGQVLVSLASKELTGDQLPEDIALVDLGAHRLADLARPERVFLVTHPDLPSDFPPLRSLDARRHNLPVALTPFVGREYELKEVANLLATARLVTLTGPGGAGKTRLALQTGAEAVDAFPDGVFLVDLAPLTDPELVVHQVMESVGMAQREGDSAELLDRLGDHLATRRLLLLLDNCEHLVEAAAVCSESLLRRAPGVVVLATSREPLGIAGEMTWRVPSLSLPPAGASDVEALSGSDAVTLFAERARAAEPEFRLAPENAAAVGQVCRRLDGIPLALELAAARLNVLSPLEIARRLDDRFRLLTGGSRTALARHQTLRAALDWGYELLSGPERELLQRLTVFPGSFSLEAAEAVGSAGNVEVPDVLDLLAHLVDRSWVTVEERGHDTRYRLLETVRQYAGEKLIAAGETEGARRRHRDFFHRFARRHAGYPLLRGSADWMPRLRVEEDNLRAAMEWSLATGDGRGSLDLVAVVSEYWAYAVRLSEVRNWLERALAGDPGPPGESRVAALNLLAYALCQQGHVDDSRVLWEEARQLAVDTHDQGGEAVACVLLGSQALQAGDLDGAESLLHRAQQAGAPVSSKLDAWCEGNLGLLALARGDLDRARARFERWLEIGRAVSGDELIAHALAALAPLVAVTGDTERAVALADEAVAIARRLGVQPIEAMACIRAAEAAVLARDDRRAAGAVRQALLVLGEIGGPAWVPDALELAGILRARAGEATVATRLLGTAAELRRAAGAAEPPRVSAGEVWRCRDDLTDKLGTDAFTDAWEEGRRAAFDEAIRLALNALNEADT